MARYAERRSLPFLLLSFNSPDAEKQEKERLMIVRTVKDREKKRNSVLKHTYWAVLTFSCLCLYRPSMSVLAQRRAIAMHFLSFFLRMPGWVPLSLVSLPGIKKEKENEIASLLRLLAWTELHSPLCGSASAGPGTG